MITLNRPDARNGINAKLMTELLDALNVFEGDAGTGTDIKEMESETYVSNFLSNKFSPWDRMAAIRKPMIAAVAGYALGGGCELAMMCDFILAADTAMFGQREIKLGPIPGMGGTQRLAKLIGTAKAMELCLTGRMMDAEGSGLVARVVPAVELLAEALKTAGIVADMSVPATLLAKEAIHRADEIGLTEGSRFECRFFHYLVALEDQKEGRAAIVEKRKPEFKHM